ncbi:MAG: PAS domain S-box protein [Chthoniobacterales bacterium]
MPKPLSRLSTWLRMHGSCSLALAALYFVFGHASFLVQVNNAVVTPVLFAPEGIALAMAIRFGPGIWPGVFVGQLCLALSRGLPLTPALLISAVNSIESAAGAWLFHRARLDQNFGRARDLAGLMLMIFFLLQPFSATSGMLSLWMSGMAANSSLPVLWINWWIGNCMGQSLITPILLLWMSGQRRGPALAMDILLSFAVLAPTVLLAERLFTYTGFNSMEVVFLPAVLIFSIYRGLAAASFSGIIIVLCALYATGHGFGPYIHSNKADILNLNFHVLGLVLTGQFLAVLLQQARRGSLAQSELYTAREQLQRTAYELTQNIPVGTYVVEFDPQGEPRFTFLSERWIAMTGMNREEVMRNHALALQGMSPEGRREIERLNREAIAGHKRFFWEGETVMRGETRRVTLESSPRKDPGGKIIWEGMMSDVTEARKASAEREKLLNNLPIAIAATTLEQPAQITFINDSFIRIFGYKHEEIPTVENWARLSYPDEAYRREVFREWDDAVMRAIKTKDSVESMEFLVTCKDGSKRNVLFGAVVLEKSLLVSMTDITERKAAELKLAENELRLRKILDNIPVPVAINDAHRDGKITFLNEKFIQTFGYTREEIPDVKTWSELAYPNEVYRSEVFNRWNAAVAKAAPKSSPVGPIEIKVVRRDGTQLDVLINTVPLNELLLVGFIDITELKKAQELLRVSEERQRLLLERKLKSSLEASAVAHEINQPLSAILLQSKMTLQDKSDPQQALAIIANEAQRVVTTIEKMKTLLRSVQTKHEFIDLGQVVKSALLYNKGLLAKNNIQLEQSGLETRCIIHGDGVQLQLALNNIFRNAVEAIAESAASLGQISVELLPANSHVDLVIGDSGPGWSGAELIELPLNSTRREGTGIGLFVIRTAVQNHEGEIFFGRSPLGGAEIRLRFPLQEGALRTPPAEES